jgi:zinc transport system substrate-binding protein
VILRLVSSRRAMLGALLLLFTACNQSGTSSTPLVVTTVYPLYEFTRQIAGSSAKVVSLVPAGAEPHDWEPSPRDLTQIRDARLLVYNGAGLDPWVTKLLEDPAIKGTASVRATQAITLETTPTGAEGRSVPDPHVWLDPVLAQSMVETIRSALAAADPEHAAAYGENAARFRAKLEALHEAFRVGLAQCARREIIASHAAFGYLARRYDLTVISLMGVAPDSEPTPGQLAAVVRFARDKKVQYIFFETLVGPRLADTIAREIGARTLPFNPIEGVARDEQSTGRDYVALMEENLKNLRVALDCR